MKTETIHIVEWEDASNIWLRVWPEIAYGKDLKEWVQGVYTIKTFFQPYVDDYGPEGLQKAEEKMYQDRKRVLKGKDTKTYLKVIKQLANQANQFSS